MPITSTQLRMARAALRWTVRHLAKAAGLHPNTITNLEIERFSGDPKTWAAVEKVLVHAGLEFIGENGGGAGVRLRQPHRLSARVSHGIASDDRFASRSGEPRRIIGHDTLEIKENLVITAEQLRAARALLGWLQSELAARAGLSLPTVKRAETESGPHVSAEARMKLKKTLESAGVSFMQEKEGLGVHLRKRRNTPK
jgi:transcriptional regulator with XRE-family HTH domain